jgi:hypothetical protein
MGSIALFIKMNSTLSDSTQVSELVSIYNILTVQVSEELGIDYFANSV